MAKDMKRYDLLISCPGDAIGAVKIVEEVIEEFNQLYSDALGIIIRSRHWSKSAYSESGGKPQNLLNKQLVDDADLAVAIFKNRFGTPTDSFGSGTEEEIEIMLAEGKQVFMFFDDSPVNPSELDRNEYDRVQRFKRKYSGKGIYWTYTSDSEFKNTFRAHITQYFMSLSKNNLSVGRSNLKIRSYKNGKLDDYVHLSRFDMGGFISSEERLLLIRDAIKRIGEMKIIKSGLTVQPALGLFAGKKVVFQKDTIDIIKTIANKLEVTLSDDFFDIGNLTESQMVSYLPFGGRTLEGTKEEKDKYNAIINLENLIDRARGHIRIEEYYGNLYGIKLILCNDGTRFDEDIDVEIIIPKDRLVYVENLPIPSNKVDLGDDWCFADIFEISATKDFISYSDTKKPLSGFTPRRLTPVDPLTGRDYEAEYRDTLLDIFDYNCYPDDDNVVIRVHFDYIKQHQCAAFPAWIFIKNPTEGIIAKYSITTKFSEDVLEGQIEIMPQLE